MLTFVVILIAAAIGGVIGKNSVSYLWSSRQPSDADLIERGFAEATPKIKATLPKRVDDHTIMVDAEHSGTVLTYTYEVQDPDRLETNALKQSVTSRVCGSSMLKSISHGAAYRYLYRDNKGTTIADFMIADADCRGKGGQ